MQMILEKWLHLITRRIVPKQGPIKGIQYLTITKSGFDFRILFPTNNQFNGFIELMQILIVKFVGAGSVLYCVLPGNKKLGYCKEKL